MTIRKLIIQSLKHYSGSALATAAGIAIATAIICGALIIGDSLQQSLLNIVDQRIGSVTHSVTAGERLFTSELAERLNTSDNLLASSVIKTEGIASVQGTALRANKIQVWGIDPQFEEIVGASDESFNIRDGGAIIGDNLAARLSVKEGDFIMLRLNNKGPIPTNTPFVSEEGQTITRRVKIQSIISRDEYAGFNLQASQTTNLNIFVDLNWLNRIMDLDNRANMVLIRAEEPHSAKELQDIVSKSWQVKDGNLIIKQLGNPDRLMITSERVFIDDYLTRKLEEIFPNAEKHLTYFVNNISFGDNATPYSFVTASEKIFNGISQLKHGEIALNRWLADDLQVNIGDSVNMRYYEVGPMRELVEKEAAFIVKGIVSMEESLQDGILMPNLPGLSDAGSCSEWEAGIPIDLEAIRQKDEDYWNNYKGAPKAYISLEKGRELWQNRFGNMTSMFIISDNSKEDIAALISQSVNPFQIEFQLNHVKDDGIKAARGGVDFSQLFAGLGMFIIISGLLLTVLLLSLSLKKREKQLKLFASLGFTIKTIQKIYLTEAFIITIAGALAGLLLSIGYSRMIFTGLNQIWHDIVRMDALTLHYSPVSMISGLLAGVILGMTAIFISIRRIIIKHVTLASTPIIRNTNKKPIRVASIIFILSLLMFLSLAVFNLAKSNNTSILPWFLTGISMLLTLLSGIYIKLYNWREAPTSMFNLNSLSLKNLRRNPARSFVIVTLLAIGSFVIVITATNRKESVDDPTEKHHGTGGFVYMAESTIPVLSNLNLYESRMQHGIPDDVNFVHFLSTYDDDASCLNLNRVENPRILATNPLNLQGRFSFVSSTPHLNPANPWESLNNNLNGVIPAIADQSVIQWGLGKKAGDTLTYINSRGENVRLLLIGGLANSIFQGNVLISEKNFLNHFPATGGSGFFLIDAPAELKDELKETLNFQMRDYGWEMTATEQKLAEFNTVENTYLSIFFLLGAFGMLLGTIGLAIIIARTMLERRSEIALMTALGFRIRMIIRLISTEYSLLFIAGILSGTASALIATLPTILLGAQNVSLTFLFSVLSIIVVNGIAWILIISSLMIKRIGLLQAIREE